MKLDFLRSTGKMRDLRQLDWPAGLRVLVLAPHPDDFDAIGVTLKYLHEAGLAIYAAVCVTGSGIDEEYGAGMSIEEKRALRIKEQIDSLRFFGLPEDHLRFLYLNNAEDEQLADDPENELALKGVVKEIRPDLVFSPHGNDTNRAHRAMCALVSRIAEGVDWPLALMLNRDAKTLDMRTDFYLTFGEADAEWKGQLLRFHDSQQQRNLKTRGHGFDDRVLDLNRAIAKELQATRPYAAAYEVRIFG
ncbi:PIG-L family deacetylase [Oxalobacter sp. OttesenSCG-928-P03]|nr:PIG-L family deacetylase [Oxalobacter sp. OttesenSCG-928-P03]